MINKILFFILLLLFSLFMEMVFLYNFPIGVILLPDFFLIITAYYAMLYQERNGQFVGFILGAAKDIFTIGIFGTNMFIFTILGNLIGKIGYKIDRENKLHQMFIVFLSTIFYTLGFWTVQKVFGYKFSFEFKGYEWIIVLKPFINALYTPILFFLFNRIASKWFRIQHSIG
jgi:rod shape-determining protein MreD